MTFAAVAGAMTKYGSAAMAASKKKNGKGEKGKALGERIRGVGANLAITAIDAKRNKASKNVKEHRKFLQSYSQRKTGSSSGI